MKNVRKMVVAMLFILCVFSVTNIQEAAAADKCYTFYYSWGCVIDDNYDYKTWSYEYVKLKDDGTYTTTAGYYGRWNVWKGSMTLRQFNGCEKLVSGTKKQGFMQCTDGSNPLGTYAPGCWYMKKTKCTMFDSE